MPVLKSLFLHPHRRAESETMEKVGLKAWWSSKRSLFNRILLSAALSSFLSLLLVSWVLESRLPCLEITLFSVLMGGMLLLFCLVLANIFYNLGPHLESLISPAESLWFRRITFVAGTLLCVVLIFSPVVGNLVAAWTWSPGEVTCDM